jgi:hypothetical protein
MDDIKTLVKQILRSRILRVHSMWHGTPNYAHKRYLMLGDDRALREFVAQIEATEPIRYDNYLI